MKEYILVCKDGNYYSQLDEDLFDIGLNKITSFVKSHGEGRRIYLHFSKKSVSNSDLRGLLGLFYRYKVDMKPLKIFLNKKNKRWFYDNKNSYWYKKVFGFRDCQNKHTRQVKRLK